ncbi:gamma-glutamyltranspeptidase/glutathione hydrolase [Pseudorhodoplanes sinuspersici]|nr:gamma-glutamyltransferase [Pseudorhodoplanes sinuspersici]RKE69232.1 gamma-glutamyltranspeptidase/glutathione hydrolase [Pseudorhodoplanes sinuspersici]
MRKFLTAAAIAMAALSPVFAPAFAQDVVLTPSRPLFDIPAVQPVTARNGMVVAQEALAARIGADILKAGGNAVDAAVATGFAMAVTYPRAGNIGGGGFMVIHLQKNRQDIAIDYREMAPAAITRTSFLNEQGDADPQKSVANGLAVGVPGTVAGLALAHRKYGSGKFTLAQLIAPAVALARDGFIVDGDLADTFHTARPLFARWPSSAKVFLKPDGQTYGKGDRLIQTDLAHTLEAIGKNGPRAFYEGPIAEKIAAAVRGAGGVMTADDLKAYRAVERAPARGRYRGYDIVSMPPPSSGGLHLIQILNILEGYDLKKSGAATPETAHHLAEAMKRAYADRAVYLGDPDFVKVPARALMSKRYATSLRTGIGEQATPSTAIRNGNPVRAESLNTTHFSVVDRFGNAVSNTYTLNLSYGNGLVAEGTGVLLNNEMDDFAAKPNSPNTYGLVGADANAPAPRKRPLSSMTPTIVLKKGKVFLVTGSPGGSRIITTVLQIMSNVIDHGMDIAQATSAPRLHHQWLPDQVSAERGYPDATLRALEARGHKVMLRAPGTASNSIMVTPKGLVGAADTRTRGALAAGY